MPSVVVRGARVRYRESRPDALHPHRPAIVLLHMAGGSSDYWAPIVTALGHHTRVVAPDLPAHGQSAGPSFERIEASARWVAEFVRTIDAVGRDGVVVAGHSMGAAIALELALGTGDLRVAGLGLIGASANLKLSDALREALDGGGGALRRFLAANSFGSTATQRTVVRGLDAHFQARTEAVVRDFRACDSFDRAADIAKVGLPVLVVVGAEDRLTPPVAARRLHDAIALSSLVELPGVGHCAVVEAPHLIATALAEHVRQQFPV